MSVYIDAPCSNDFLGSLRPNFTVNVGGESNHLPGLQNNDLLHFFLKQCLFNLAYPYHDMIFLKLSLRDYAQCRRIEEEKEKTTTFWCTRRKEVFFDRFFFLTKSENSHLIISSSNKIRLQRIALKEKGESVAERETFYEEVDANYENKPLSRITAFSVTPSDTNIRKMMYLERKKQEFCGNYDKKTPRFIIFDFFFQN